LQLGRKALGVFEQYFEKTLALQEWRRVLEANQGIPARGVIPQILGTNLEESYSSEVSHAPDRLPPRMVRRTSQTPTQRLRRGVVSRLPVVV
jgi:hypothetical protein